MVEWEIGAYKLEEGGVLQMGVGVQRSLQQHPPGARESRRGGATASHTYRRLLTCRVRAVSLCGDIINRDFARYYLAPKIRPSRIADANPCKMNICVHVVEKMSQPSLAV
jgi:hypothetical protein